MNIFIYFGILCYISTANCGKILHVMPFSGKSHYNAQKDLSLELAKRGHEVFVITPYEEKDPPSSYHQIFVDSTSVFTLLFDKRPNVFDLNAWPITKFQNLFYESGFHLNELVFNSTAVQKFMKEDHKFDLVINELFYQESLYMFAHKYQAPQILITTFGNAFKQNFYLRNPLQLSTLYHEFSYSNDPTSFFGRLRNLYFCVNDLLWLKFWYLPRQEEYARKYFTELQTPVPSLEELAANVSLVLMNSHFSVDTAAAYLPNFIEVAGLNLKEPQPLPEDIKAILDKASDGVVYMSFGSNVRTTELENSKLQAFFKIFSKLKQVVLMKYEDLSRKPNNIPGNVILREWFPQRDILAHPNVKLFISHGGLLGFQESTASGVPILGIPIFGDQYGNILQGQQNGYALLLEYKEINDSNLDYYINKMLNETSFINSAREIAKRFYDRPMNALDTAIWWIEYVMRNRGAEFIKSPALKLSYLEYSMLDVFAVICITILSVFVILIYLCYKCFNVLLKFKNVKVKRQ